MSLANAAALETLHCRSAIAFLCPFLALSLSQTTMASLDAGHDRAAMLKQTERRNRFVSRIEKYEAKVKQDLKARGLLREQRVTTTPAFFPRLALGQKLPSTGKADRRKACDVTVEKVKYGASFERELCHSQEREDPSEHNIITTVHGHCTTSNFVGEKEKLKNDDALLEGSIYQSGEREDSSEHRVIAEQRGISHSVAHDGKTCYLIAEKAKLKNINKLFAHKARHSGKREDSSQQKIIAEQREILHSTMYRHKSCDLVAENACALVAEKTDIVKDDGVLEHKNCQSGEREDSPEQKIIAEQREICVQHKFDQSDRSSSYIIHYPDNIYASDKKEFPGISFAACKLSAAAELNITAIAIALKIRLKAADMSLEMQEYAFRLAREILDSLDKLQCKRIAYTLKKEFDKVHGPAWHCIVGTNFGSYVTHSLGGFIYFSLDKVSVLLFKTAVEPLEK